MDQLAKQTSSLGIFSPRIGRGFNNLPGELHNKIYETLQRYPLPMPSLLELPAIKREQSTSLCTFSRLQSRSHSAMSSLSSKPSSPTQPPRPSARFG
ncbi:hypothetical protein HBH56_242430 [Parastagonospora nodorum]|uniref:Uncharacterized protein n=1 Tax=Phaeosphaeria nodorum (strain SN15 / ATCC MYA-4574 / FGSC 10173) TaxID=321614 RepID=A0A7U2EUS5_PHANO|nr:hypothetical protein HBH56_242430 [Parastagonospora nodorum]QRC93097.1 hypothetical protein JI435_403330 [Parastagonospora nodorum SN15]KAH3921124.1 hypothetical protein HBH54_245010 [Parastagonospora nodorum]KAH4143638.1 hypothetical protein HBH45_039850 [Parastagonospora nodorum]KAH4146335.1 hypothetical protein HBH44_243440 [Parastagonospora nodorum]